MQAYDLPLFFQRFCRVSKTQGHARGFKSLPDTLGLPTELPVLCRQNCFGDRF